MECLTQSAFARKRGLLVEARVKCGEANLPSQERQALATRLVRVMGRVLRWQLAA